MHTKRLGVVRFLVLRYASLYKVVANLRVIRVLVQCLLHSVQPSVDIVVELFIFGPEWQYLHQLSLVPHHSLPHLLPLLLHTTYLHQVGNNALATIINHKIQYLP